MVQVQGGAGKRAPPPLNKEEVVVVVEEMNWIVIEVPVKKYSTSGG